MNIYQPYFYIIQEISTGIYYVGAKWKHNEANPKTFMTEDGYKTSSKIINNLIEKNGLESFTIRKIKIFNTATEAYNFETRFLRKVDAKNNIKFYNQHNNDHLISFGTDRYKEMMFEYHGVEHPAYSKKIQINKRNTIIQKYGVDHYSKTTEYKEKYTNTSLEKYGCKHPMQNEDIKQKLINSNKSNNNGVYFVNSTKTKNTKFEKYGDENYNNTEKAKKTKEIRYGSSKFVNSKKAKKTCIEKYGFPNPAQSPIVSNKISKKCKQKTERENVKILRELSKTHNIFIGYNWSRKDDEFINQKIKEIKNLLNLK